MMSDAVANSLLSSCKHTLKYLSEALTTLDSISALTRLREDGEALEALKVIGAFTQSLLPSSTRPTTPERILSVSSATVVETKVSRYAPLALSLRPTQNRLEHVPGGPISPALDVEAYTREDLRVQDGRDETIYETRPVQNSTPDYSSLLGPTPSSVAPGQRFYSILVYFPAFFLSIETVTVKEKQMLLDLVHSASGGNISNAGPQLTTTSYPRIRLIPGCFPSNKTDYSYSPTAVLILDNYAERLRRIQKELHAVQYQRWSNLDKDCTRRDLFFVRAWGESPVVLVFRFNSWDQPHEVPSLKTRRAVIAALFQRYPILAHYQCDPSSAGPRIAVGKAVVYHGYQYPPYSTLADWTKSRTTCILMPLFHLDHRYPDATMDFALDFAAEHSEGVDVPLEGIPSEIYVDRMRDPELWSSPGGAAWERV